MKGTWGSLKIPLSGTHSAQYHSLEVDPTGLVMFLVQDLASELNDRVLVAKLGQQGDIPMGVQEAVWGGTDPKTKEYKNEKEGNRGNTQYSNPGSKMGWESRQRPAQREKITELMGFTDHQETRGPPLEVMAWGWEGQNGSGQEEHSTHKDSAQVCPLSLLTHTELLLQGFSYLRRLPRQVCADTQVRRCRYTCRWGSCIPFAFQHSHASALHTHPGLERMCNHKFIREAALISCILHIKQY